MATSSDFHHPHAHRGRQLRLRTANVHRHWPVARATHFKVSSGSGAHVDVVREVRKATQPRIQLRGGHETAIDIGQSQLVNLSRAVAFG